MITVVRALFPLVVATAAVLAPAAAHAKACARYEADGHYQIQQSNGYTVNLNVSQGETGLFEGTATYTGASGIARGSVGANGKFDLVIEWDNGSVGDYTGWIDDQGRIIEGTAFDRAHPESRATWSMVQPLRCGR